MQISQHSSLTDLWCAGELAPCGQQQACLQRGADDGPGCSRWPEDPSLVLYSDPATQPGGGGPGGGHRDGHWGSWKHCGGLFLPL